MCPQADLWARLWAMGGSPTLPLALACVFCLPSPCPKATSRMEPWNRNVLLRLLDWVSDKTQSRLLHKLLRFRLIGTEFYSSWRWWNSSWAMSNPERWCCESAAQYFPSVLVCWSPWDRKETDMTEQLTWSELNWESEKSLMQIWWVN